MLAGLTAQEWRPKPRLEPFVSRMLVQGFFTMIVCKWWYTYSGFLAPR